MSRPRVFWFHYNKPASRKAGRNILTVHFADQCHLVHDVVLNSMNLRSATRSAQPRCILRGVVAPDKFQIIDNVAYIG